MRGIARTDSLVRLVMWGALLAAAWILLSPGKASASEHPVKDVERSVSSLAGTVLGHAPEDDSSRVEGSLKAPNALQRKGIGTDGARSVRSLVEPALKPAQPVGRTLKPVLEPVARPLEPVLEPVARPLEPVVAATTHTVRATVHEVTSTVSSTSEVVPGLQAPVHELTGLVDDLVEAVPVVGSEPVIELPVPGLPGATSPADPDPRPDAPGPDTSVGEAAAPAPLPVRDSAAGRRNHHELAEDVTAQREPTGPPAPRAAGPAPSVGAEVSADDSAPTPQPWPSGLPSPAGPVPAPSSAGAAGQSTGGDVPADLSHATQCGATATTAAVRDVQRAPGALNDRPGLRPD